MKKLILLAALVIFGLNILAQTKQEKSVAAAVEQLRKAMIDGDSAMLEKLTLPELSYGHSGGHIDNKRDFVDKIVSGKSDFVTLEFANQTIAVSKNVAIVRHTLNAKTNDSGKPGEVHLGVMLIWQKLNGQWKLLARQAVKIQ